MLRRVLAPAAILVLILSGSAFAGPSALRWPPWLSIESPVNPYDPATRDAVLLVHTTVRDGHTTVADLSGSAEGLVGGTRRSVPLRFDTTAHSGVYAVRRQWPLDGTWLLRITLLGHTTALVTLGPSGDVVAARVPTRRSTGVVLPRAVAAAEIDSALAIVARTQ
ncbi:MAG TPA: hypothetical protein VFW66_12370 [Gemmatimonadales bacterium]|nr:hypothetical protein [Gemmatimonadales bacterium]